MAQRTNREQQAGFTIIEIILFLAVTGALVAALLGGVGIALNNQRYQDAVQSFKSLLQSEFTNLDSVANDRDATWSCDKATAKTTQPSSGSTQARGRSECYIVGRYITIEDSTFKSTDVIASDSSTTTTKTNPTDIDLMTGNYHYSLSTVLTESQDLQWGTQIAWPTPATGSAPHDSAQAVGTSRSIVILIVRSPDSGITYLFTKDSHSTNDTDPTKVQEGDILGMMKAGNVVPGQGDRLICLESNQLSTNGNMGFYIEAYATNASAIQTRSNDTKLVGGNATC